MDGATEDSVWKLRRTVLTGLLVVGVATTAFAVVASRPDDEAPTADDPVGDEVVTTVRPSNPASEGPLRLGDIVVVGRHGNPVAEPENTAESFASAIDAGVTHVEADVVMTQDGQLLVQSSNQLSRTTDVADRPEFADREVTKTIDGADVTDWFSEDFTLDELRTLRAVEPQPAQRPESATHDGDYALIGFDDLVTQLEDASDESGREIGLFVRPVRPSYFRTNGLPIEPALVATLKRERLVFDPERVTVESPDLEVLQRIEDSVGGNVLTSYVISTGSADELDDIDDLPPTIDAVAIETGAFTGRNACDLGESVDEAGLALVVYPVSYENALLGNSFKSEENPDPGAPGNLAGLLSGLRDIGTDVVLAESPTEVMQELADLPTDQKSACD